MPDETTDDEIDPVVPVPVPDDHPHKDWVAMYCELCDHFGEDTVDGIISRSLRGEVASTIERAYRENVLGGEQL